MHDRPERAREREQERGRFVNISSNADADVKPRLADLNDADIDVKPRLSDLEGRRVSRCWIFISSAPAVTIPENLTAPKGRVYFGFEFFLWAGAGARSKLAFNLGSRLELSILDPSRHLNLDH
ncbi:hypothetical protein GYMLUDRAFT_418222 [Collybiopsis luxurians FD-317 M1]|uniref:Uncharacterized protein n=1 Tax=Collybiopsis luxurians FD-317 M1 TaxID=944289 RepID=A0A0D0BMX3_9AGAR|nr:hypothetical protein GYMLUDRAFT_418222 [Collybiopsis luxurians FD-317 M1]